ERLIAEETYANRLQVISRLKSKAPEETPTLLSQICGTMKIEMQHISEGHRNMGLNLSRLLRAIQVYLDDNRKLASMKKESIDASYKRIERYRHDVEIARREAAAKWEVAVAEEKKYEDGLATGGVVGGVGGAGAEQTVETMDVLMSFGEQSFTAHEFNLFIANAQQDIPSQDVRSILLGTYKAVVAGEDVFNYVKARLRLDDNPAKLFCGDLVTQGFIKTIGRGSGFGTNQQYQWKRTSVDSEPPHLRASREAEQAEHNYRMLVKAAESARSALETECIEPRGLTYLAQFMRVVEIAQRKRLNLVKETVSSFITFDRSHIPYTVVSCDRISVILETLSPEREIQLMAERDRTGNARLPSFVYVPQTPLAAVQHEEMTREMRRRSGGGSATGEATTTTPVSARAKLSPRIASPTVRVASEQLFGVAIEDAAALSGRRVPPLIRKLVRAIVKGMEGVEDAKATELQYWLEPNMHSPETLALRAEINYSRTVLLSTLKKQPVPILVGLAKLWMVQTPISVCGHEIYEPLKLLYLS
ncbi:hypothetical protein HK101_005810, partial [Irineochytrium annulatum]